MTKNESIEYSISDHVASLRRLEALGVELRQNPAVDSAGEPDPRVSEYVRLQDQLPAPLLASLRGRIRTGERLIATAPNGSCRSCYTAMPRGDHSTLIAGQHPIFCQHCGVLLVPE